MRPTVSSAIRGLLAASLPSARANAGGVAYAALRGTAGDRLPGLAAGRTATHGFSVLMKKLRSSYLGDGGRYSCSAEPMISWMHKANCPNTESGWACSAVQCVAHVLTRGQTYPTDYCPHYMVPAC